VSASVLFLGYRETVMGKDLWKLAVPPLIFYFLSLSLTQPLGSQVVVKLVCAYDSNHDVNDDDCGSKSIAEKAGWIVTSMFVASSLPSMIMNGNYGRISDLYGRKYITIIPFVGTTIFALALAFVSHYQPAQYIPILLISSFINGFCGIYSVVTMGLFTFAADSLTILPSGNNGPRRTQAVSVDETGHVSHGLPCASRTAFAYSIMEGAISCTRLVGPTLGGLLSERVDHSFVLALLVAAASTTLGALWVGLVMPAVSVPTGASERRSDPSGAVGGEIGEAESDLHFWKHTEAAPDPGHEAAASKEFKFNFLITFQNIYWLIATVPTLVAGARPDSLGAIKQEIDRTSGRPPKPAGAHQQDVLVHLRSVPYFAVAYFLFFTVLVASDAVLMVVFLINVYDFGPALIGKCVLSILVLLLCLAAVSKVCAHSMVGVL
jgi:MFS family permease